MGDTEANLKFSELFINDNAIDTRVGATLQFGGVVTKNGTIIVSTEHHDTLNKSGLLDITNGSAELRIADSIASKSAHHSG